MEKKIKKILVTGGCGFIGSNYVARLLARGEEVIVLDNFSRDGAHKNLAWLQRVHGDSFKVISADVRNASAVSGAIEGVDAIVHLAGQVAVTSSIENPREDFEINAIGTFNILEAARQSDKQPLLLYASTNKVYGGMENLAIDELTTRYAYRTLPFGVPETQPLDFHSPYGCSKGAGDQYVRDYARIYGLPTVVLRQSCIYGWRQFGVEDQGWLAHFMIATLKDRPITIFGNGKQVRDMLWIDDLLNVYDICINQPQLVAGKVYNIGGGVQNTLSIWHELESLLWNACGKIPEVLYNEWRPGDQKSYISDISKAQHELNWQPKVTPEQGH